MPQSKVLPVTLVLVCLQVSYMIAAQINCTPSFQVVESGNCAQRYQYKICDSDPWIDAKCVGGFFNTTKGKCEPFGPNCPSTMVTDRLLGRQKRQAQEYALNCNRTYYCPSTLKELFIYPDWENTNCDTYVVCLSGRLVLESCTLFGLSFYNPRRLSCESTATATNTCVFRLNTDLGPILR